MRYLVLVLALTACKREERTFDPIAPSYSESAYAVSQGKALYSAFNCDGCHAHGGGGSGPAFLDHEWRYGSTPQAVIDSIRQGRPRGMPAFEGKIAPTDIPMLAAYVRSLGGLVRGDSVSARDEHMSATPPESLQHVAVPLPGKATP